jgi:hypothetical protein
MRMGRDVAFEYRIWPSDTTSAAVSSTVAARDAQVEQAVGHVPRDLLRAQDAHLVDARVGDGRLVLDAGRAVDRQVGRLEQVEGGPFERAFGEDELEHGVEGRHHGAGSGKPVATPARTAA